MRTAAATTTTVPHCHEMKARHSFINTTFFISGKTGGQSAKCNFSDHRVQLLVLLGLFYIWKNKMCWAVTSEYCCTLCI